MFFKPKIFISSTFSENKNLREEIESYFLSVGAEPLLYESRLTPSTKPLTYREDICDADFIIIIIKEIYGTLTDWDISGTHEEYIIARNQEIPMHVYLINKCAEEIENNPLIEDIKKDRVSYYFFDTDEDLLKRLKETTFTIAKEIMINKIEKCCLTDASIKRLSYNRDYSKAIEVIQIVEAMKQLIKKEGICCVTTDIISSFIDPINYELFGCSHYFFNWKLDDLLKELIKSYNDFENKHVLDFTTHGNPRTYNVPVLNKISVHKVSYYKCTDVTLDYYYDLVDQILNKYECFKEAVMDLRINTDL